MKFSPKHFFTLSKTGLFALFLVSLGCTSQDEAANAGGNGSSEEPEEELATNPFIETDTNGGVEISSGDFELVGLQSVNASNEDGSGSIRQLQLTWDLPETESTSIDYRICLFDEAEIDSCFVLGTLNNELVFTTELAGLLEATYQSFFVLADDGTTTFTSSRKQIHPGELGKLAGYFKPFNPGDTDNFGHRVKINNSGTSIAVSAYMEDSASTGIDGDGFSYSDAGVASGAVYVFSETDSVWQQATYIKASNPDRSDYFGFSISLNSEGTLLAVGAYGESSDSRSNPVDNSLDDAGAVYIFRDNGSYWEQTHYLKDANPEEKDRFGYHVSLSDDGSRLAVGMPYESSDTTTDSDGNPVAESGAVIVFDYDGAGWNQVAYLEASNLDAEDRFGQELSLSGDGLTLAVGVSLEDSSATTINGDDSKNDAEDSGAAYIFTYESNEWTQTAYIKASNAQAEDYFGDSVGLNQDGTVLVVGATYEDSAATGINGDKFDNSGNGSGAVYVFELDGGDWVETAYIKGANTEGAPGSFVANPELPWEDETDDYWGDHFGRSVTLSDDGDRLVVGTMGEDSAAIGINSEGADNSIESAGAVYVFDFDSEAAVWSQTHYVKPPNTQEGDRFGHGIDLTGDGKVLVVGAYAEESGSAGVNSEDTNFDDDSGNDLVSAGAAYLY